MSDAPERIWIDDEREIGGSVRVINDEPCYIDPYTNEYVRADLYEAQAARIAELEAKNGWLINESEDVARMCDAAWNAALEAAVEAVQQSIFDLLSSDPDLALSLALYGRDAIRALRKGREDG